VLAALAVTEKRSITAILTPYGMCQVIAVDAIAAFVTQFAFLITLSIHTVPRFIGMSDVETAFAMDGGKAEVAILRVP
jgi:hypothetical protein